MRPALLPALIIMNPETLAGAIIATIGCLLLCGIALPLRRRPGMVLGGVAVAAVCVMLLFAHHIAQRVQLDVPDLSDSAAKSVSKELSALVHVFALIAVGIGIITPRILRSRARSGNVREQSIVLGVSAGLIAIGGTIAAHVLVGQVGRTFGVTSALLSGMAAIGAVWGFLVCKASLQPRPNTRIVAAIGMVCLLLCGLWHGTESVGFFSAALVIIGYLGVTIACLGMHPWHPKPMRRTHVAAGVAAATLLMAPYTLLSAYHMFEHDAVAHVRASAPKPPKDAIAFAVCIARARFAVVIPSMGEGGSDLILPSLLVDRSQFEDADDLDHLVPGTIIPATWQGADFDAPRYQLKAKVAHGDHFHNYDFAVMNANRADLRDLAAFFAGHAGSLLMLIGAAAGVLACAIADFARTACSPWMVATFIVVIGAATSLLGGPGAGVGLLLAMSAGMLLIARDAE